jgi:hypothetical protein
VARFTFTAEERFKMANEAIRAARNEVQWMMKEGFIVDPDK